MQEIFYNHKVIMKNLKVLKQKAQNIKFFLMDVDGVLTDGKLYYTERGEEIKVFNVKDGLGIKLLQMAGIPCGVISGRKSPALERRLIELEVDEIHLGYNEKLSILEDILKRRNLSYENVAYIGDDYVDLPILKRVGLPMAVRDAHPIVKRHALYVTKVKGGEGALREAIEFFLDLSGFLSALIDGM